MFKPLLLLMVFVSLGASACQDAEETEAVAAPSIRGRALNYDLLAAQPWKQLTRSPGKFTLCRFTRDEAHPDQLRVTMSTGNGQSLQGLFRFTDQESAAPQRRGLFILDEGLIEESVTLRLLSKDRSLIIVDSMGQEQRLRPVDKLSRSR